MPGGVTISPCPVTRSAFGTRWHRKCLHGGVPDRSGDSLPQALSYEAELRRIARRTGGHRDLAWKHAGGIGASILGIRLGTRSGRGPRGGRAGGLSTARIRLMGEERSGDCRGVSFSFAVLGTRLALAKRAWRADPPSGTPNAHSFWGAASPSSGSRSGVRASSGSSSGCTPSSRRVASPFDRPSTSATSGDVPTGLR